jgi:hypothetical protein
MQTRTFLGLGAGGILALLGVAGALAGLAAERDLWSPPDALPQALALVAVAAVLVVLAAFAHALRRADLTRGERAVLAFGTVLVPFGAIAYWTLGAGRTRAFARRFVALFEPEAPARASP